MTLPTETTQELVCTGCGSRQTDAELLAAREANPALIACCPERDMQPETTAEDAVWRAVQEETGIAVLSIVMRLKDGRMASDEAINAIIAHCESYHRQAVKHGI